MFSYVVEEVGHWQSFYNGRNIFSARARICKKLAMATSRPIVSSLSKQLALSLLEAYGLKRWLKLLLDETGVAQATTFEVSLGSSITFHRALIIDGDACRHCGTVRFNKKSFVHPCTHTNLTNDDFVCVSSSEYGAMIENWHKALSDHQRYFVDEVTNNIGRRKRYFLTGFAGCGKTLTLNCVIAKLISKLGVFRVAAVSYTKSAANEVHGSSIHSLFNFGKEDLNTLTIEKALDLVRKNKKKEATLVNLHTLIIDEVSLLTGTGLDLIEETMRCVRNSSRPFGGVQVVLCGDCLQLPPIERDKKRKSHVTKHQNYSFSKRMHGSRVVFVFAICIQSFAKAR